MRGRPFLLCGGLFLAAGQAWGHGTYPRTYDGVYRDGHPNEMLVGTSIGVLHTPDRGASWRWICEEALGAGEGQRATWAITKSGVMFAAAIKGLYVSRDRGCSWHELPGFTATGASDVQTLGNQVVVTTERYGETNGIWVSNDDGLSFTARQSASERFFSRARIAPSNAQRVYASSWWFDPVATASLWRSDDGAKTFTELELTAQLPAAGAFKLLAVHPLDANVLLAQVSDHATYVSYLLKSDDGGAHFKSVATAQSPFTSAAFGTGPHVWAANSEQLVYSTDGAETFSAASFPAKNACVFGPPEGLITCGWLDFDGWVAARIASPTQATAWLQWENIAGPLECPAHTSTGSQCPQYWQVLVGSYPWFGGPDAGERGDGGAVPTPSSAPVTPRRCGCGQAGFLGVAPWLLLAGFHFRRRR